MTELNYCYSQLSSHTIQTLAEQNYFFPGDIRVCYYVLGLHDNYLLYSAGQRYILRVYRNDWRSQDEIEFELQLLDYLNQALNHQQDLAVAAPRITKHNRLYFSVECPEGARQVALFPYAAGYAPEQDLTIEQSQRLGHGVALLHRLSKSFNLVSRRPALDLDYLLDHSLVSLKRFLRTEELAFLRQTSDNLYKKISAVADSELDYGVCVGDVNTKNFHITEDGRITLFDFDQCGYGLRAFEIAKYSSSLLNSATKRPLMDAFLAGYSEVRGLHPDEQMIIPYLEIAALIWVMAIHANNEDRIGNKYLNRAFWEKRVLNIRNALSII